MVAVTEAKHARLSPHQTSQCMWLMQALGFLLSALPVEEILRNLHSLITPYIQQLEKLADETVCTHDSHQHTLPSFQTLTRAHVQLNRYKLNTCINCKFVHTHTRAYGICHTWQALLGVVAGGSRSCGCLAFAGEHFSAGPDGSWSCTTG